jgi:hypothetical protein
MCGIIFTIFIKEVDIMSTPISKTLFTEFQTLLLDVEEGHSLDLSSMSPECMHAFVTYQALQEAGANMNVTKDSPVDAWVKAHFPVEQHKAMSVVVQGVVDKKWTELRKLRWRLACAAVKSYWKDNTIDTIIGDGSQKFHDWATKSGTTVKKSWKAALKPWRKNPDEVSVDDVKAQLKKNRENNS